jgi:hypothetical protein
MRIPDDDRVAAPNHSLPSESSRAEPRYGWLQLLLLASRIPGLRHQRLRAADDKLHGLPTTKPLDVECCLWCWKAAKAVGSSYHRGVRVSEQMHARTRIPVSSMACFVYLVRLALSQTCPSAQRLLLYAWSEADDTPRRPEAGGPRRDASETFSRRPTRLRIRLAYLLPC